MFAGWSPAAGVHRSEIQLQQYTHQSLRTLKQHGTLTMIGADVNQAYGGNRAEMREVVE